MRRAVVFIIAGALLLWVAVYNGYPLVWWDSGTYVGSSFVLEVPASRPIFYGLFLLATHWRLTLWGAVAAQSAMVVYLLGVSLRHVGGVDGAARRRDGELLWITACLAVGTSLPWLIGWIMPDVFTGVGVLSLFLLLFHRLSQGERTAVGAMLILSIVVHSSHLLLAIALVLLVQCASLARRARTPSTGGLRMAWLCVAISLVLTPATNWLLTRRASLSQGAATFILARLLDDGIPQKLLAEHCADRQYQLCAYRADLPRSAGYYMWNPESPLHRIGGWDGSQAESWRLIRDCLSEYPLLVAQGAGHAFVSQLGRFHTGGDWGPFLDGTAINDEIRERFPTAYRRYRESHQQQGRLPVDRFAALHWWVFACSAPISIGIVLRGLRRDPTRTAKLHAFVWAAIVCNAAIVATLVVPDNRYGARVAWLIPFSVLVSSSRGFEWWRASRRRGRSGCHAA